MTFTLTIELGADTGIRRMQDVSEVLGQAAARLRDNRTVLMAPDELPVYWDDLRCGKWSVSAGE